MENFKHMAAAAVAILLVTSLAAVQAKDFKNSGDPTKLGVWNKNPVSFNANVKEEGNSPSILDVVEGSTGGTVIDLNKTDNKENDKKQDSAAENKAPAVSEEPVWKDSVANVAEKVSSSELPIESTSPFVAAVTEGVIGDAQESTQTAVMGVSDEVVDEKVGYVILSEGALNVRIGPSTDSEVVDQLDCADKVNIVEKLDGWYKVTYGEDLDTGYVSSVSVTHSKKEAEDARLKAFMYETGEAVVSEGALNVRSGAGTNFPVIDQLDNKESVIVIEKDNEWFKVYYGVNYDTGYVIGESINISGAVNKDEVSGKQSERVERTIKGKGKIAVEGGVNVRSTPNETSSIVSQIAEGAKVSILDEKEDWTKIAFDSNTVIGYVKSEFITEAVDPTPAPKVSESSSSKSSEKSSKSSEKSSKSSSKSSDEKSSKSESGSSKSSSGSSKGQAIVETAKKYLGVKYVYGGSSPSGFDCSGLVQYVCRQNGISVSRSSKEQFHNGVAVSRDNLQPGDLVFFQSGGSIHHVGIYVGNGQMIHAPQTGKTVSYQSINTPGRIKGYAGARRVV